MGAGGPSLRGGRGSSAARQAKVFLAPDAPGRGGAAGGEAQRCGGPSLADNAGLVVLAGDADRQARKVKEEEEEGLERAEAEAGGSLNEELEKPGAPGGRLKTPVSELEGGAAGPAAGKKARSSRSGGRGTASVDLLGGSGTSPENGERLAFAA